jgi:hypothetical protein
MYREGYMLDPMNNSGISDQKQPAEIQGAGRVWVKPMFERLSLKDALTGMGAVTETATSGSHS